MDISSAANWQNNPVKSDIPEASGEFDSRFISNSYMTISGASVRGKAHRHRGLCRDDSLFCDTLDDIAFLAVSDGAGSKPLSRLGADTVCKASVKKLRSLFKEIIDENKSFKKILSNSKECENYSALCEKFSSSLVCAVKDAVSAVSNCLNEHRQNPLFMKYFENGIDFSDFSCTLLLCTVIPLENSFFTISFQLGDGLICTVNDQLPFTQAVNVLAKPDSGSFAGETKFISENLSDNEISSRIYMKKSDFSVLMLMTDGVADDYFPACENIPLLFRDLQMCGALPFRNSETSVSPPESMPKPSVYTDNNGYDTAVSYSRKIIETLGISPSQYWENENLAKSGSPKNFGFNVKDVSSSSLCTWLSLYTIKGSFDDRTLITCTYEGTSGV